MKIHVSDEISMFRFVHIIAFPSGIVPAKDCTHLQCDGQEMQENANGLHILVTYCDLRSNRFLKKCRPLSYFTFLPNMVISLYIAHNLYILADKAHLLGIVLRTILATRRGSGG